MKIILDYEQLQNSDHESRDAYYFLHVSLVETCVRINDMLVKFVNTGHQIDITRAYFRP